MKANQNTENNYTILNELLEGCQVIGFDWKYIYVNDAASKHNRRSKEELLGNSYIEIWPGIEETKVFSLLKDCLENRNTHKFQNKFVFPDGDIGWFELSIQPVKEGVFILSIDNTEFKKAEKRLLESEDYNRKLFDESTIGLAVTNLNGQLVDINRAYANIIGYSIEEAKQLTYWDITPEKYSKQEQEQIISLEQTGSYGPYEKEYIHKNGKLIPVRLQGNLIERHGQKFIWSSVEDITKQVITVKALKASEEKFRKAFMTSPDSINITSVLEGRYLEISKGFENAFGYKPKEVVGKTSLELNIWKNPEDRQRLLDGLQKMGSVRNLDVELVAKNGKIIHGLISANFIKLNNENVILSITRDITERKQNEFRIRESEEHFRTIFEQSASGMILLALDGVLLNVNTPFCEMLGYSAEELKGKNVDDVTLLEDRKIGNEIIKQMLDGEVKKARFKKRYLTKAGKIIWGQINSALLYDEHGNPKNFISQIEDITKQIEVEDALKLSEEKFEKSFRLSPYMVSLSAMDGLVIEVNDVVFETLGYTRDEFIGSSTTILPIWVNPDERKNFVEHLKQDGTIHENEVKFRKKSGEIRDYLLSACIIELNNTKVLLSIIHDNTERKQNEEKIRENEERFRTLFEQSASGMCLTDTEGKLILVNAPLCEMLAYSKEELTGKHFNAITHPDDLLIGVDAVAKMLKGDTKKVVFEKRYLKKTGESVWVHINAALLRDEHNNPKFFVTQMEDITPRIESEIALKSSENKFKALVEQSLTGIYIFEKEKFIYVNNRFCEIFGYSEEEIMAGMKPTDVISIEDRARANENVKKRLAGETQSVRYSAKGNHKSGKLLWVEIHGTHIQMKGKEVITGTVLDITDRKKAEEEIIKLNEEMEKEIEERTHDLEIKISEIQRMNKLFVGRELRMKELKEKMKELEFRLKNETNS